MFALVGDSRRFEVCACVISACGREEKRWYLLCRDVFAGVVVGVLVRERSWSYGVMVSTLDFESSDPGSNPGRTSFLLATA